MQPAAPRYRPREVGNDVIAQVIDLHLAAFVEGVESEGGQVPDYVLRAFWDYLDCGRPEGGFILLRCPCGKARLLPFSCKNRGFCPSCLGRRMSQLSANLADHVLPTGVPLRQWVLSFPFPVRLWLLWRPSLRKAVLAVVQRLLFGWYARKAADAGAAGGRTGAVVCAQPFGGALNANMHFHIVLLDGAYARDEDTGELTFHRVRPPSDEDVQALVDEVRRRVERLLRRRGLLSESEPPDDAPAPRVPMVALGQDPVRDAEPRPRRSLPSKCAESGFFNLHAGVRIADRDEEGKERLLRYLLRPPLVLDRLSMREDGNVVLRLKNAWRDGTTALVLTPFAFLSRLAAIVPRPRERWLTTHGVLSPHASWRSEVVPDEAEREARRAARQVLQSPRTATRQQPRCPYWVPWRELLARVFGVEGLLCSCGRLMHVHAVVMGAATARALHTLRRSPHLIRGPP